MEEINYDNYRSVDTGKLGLDKNRFGPLTFERSVEYLKKAQQLLMELEELSYDTKLTERQIADINQKRDRFIELLNRLRTFDMQQQPDFAPQRDSFQEEVKNFYEDFLNQLMPPITFLRQELTLTNKDQVALNKMLKGADQALKSSQEAEKKLNDKLKDLEAREKQLQTKSGKVGAKQLARYFSDQVGKYSDVADRWLMWRNIFYCLILGLIAFLAYKIFTESLSLSLEQGVAKAAIIAFLSYGLAFASRNYRIYSHLAEVTRHRKNVAQTLDDFLGTEPDGETKSEMLKHATEAMFKHLSVGHIGRHETKDSGGVHDIVKLIFPNREH